MERVKMQMYFGGQWNLFLQMNHIRERFDLIVEDIKSKQNWIELPDKDKLVVEENDKSPVMNDCRLGRYKLKQNWIELLDRDKLVVEKND